MRTRLTILLILLASLISGCSLKNLSVKATSELLPPGLEVFESEADIQLAHEAAAAQIKLMETLHRSDPRRAEVLLALTRALGSYAFAFLEWEAESNADVRKRAASLYNRGAGHGLELLDLKLGGGTALLARSGSLEAFKSRLEGAKKEDVPALFWTAYDWAGAIRKSADSPRAVAELPRAVALAERALKLDPGYHYGAIHLFFGVYFAERPPLLGGDPKQAEKHFSEAVSVGGGKYVMAKYLWAKTYAVRIQDAKLFEKLLKEVMNTPDDLLPEQRLAQEIAKDWARKLLKQKPNYFGES
ncbi:MAG TPA: TRAP transporter TatT component family protein [Bdellovibrionota bacterium]|nr:TRAP transporter TatT component family protein [Bdellovibrionota bacterium]